MRLPSSLFFIPLFDLKHKTHTTRVTGNYHIAAIVKMVTPARNRYDTVSIIGKDATIAARCAKCNECSNLWVVWMLQCGIR
jgi:hypothetical protein